MKRLALLLVGLLVGFAPMLMAPSGGFPSRPTFGFLAVRGAAAQIDLIDTDSGADETRWRLATVGAAGQLQLQTVNDALSGSAPVLTVDRTGTTVDAIALAGVAMMPTETTATGTATGCTTAPTTTVRFVRHGNLVVATADPVTCTSNTTGFTLTAAVPAALQPTRTQCAPARIFNNTAEASGVVCVTAASTTLTFGIGAAPGGGFTAAGTKGISAPQPAFSYVLN